MVFRNRIGPFLGHGFTAFSVQPTPLEGDFPSGLVQWTTGSVTLGSVPRPAAGVSWQAEGLLDRFGDGELAPVSRTNIDTHVDTAIFNSNLHENCLPGSLSTIFESWQKAGEADLNGDGLADHLYASSDDVATALWYVRFNTGVGFTAPRLIQAHTRFAVSEANGLCGADAQSAAGLTDLDGDGVPELLRVSGGVLRRSTLEVNPLEVGRLTRIFNGYGAWTYISYANAKADTATKHAVPFAEVVVAETGTHVVGAGTEIAPTFYAYGDASLTYEPLAGGWLFSGYRRSVAMTGLPGEEGARNGLAVVTDRTAPATPGSTWSAHVTSQQVTRTRFVEGAFHPSSLGSLLVGDPLSFAETDTQFGSKQLLPSIGGVPNLDCADLDPFNGIAVGTSRCGSGGIVFATVSSAWEGTAAPPTLLNTQASSSTNEVDDFGRPTSSTSFGDLRRTDDDVCTSLEYATPPNGGAFPSVPSTMTITDCGWGNAKGGRPGAPRTLSVVRFYYDEQPHGAVSLGRLTSREVDRYGPFGYLDTHTVARTNYDDFGEIATISTERAQGTATSHTIEFTRDDFGATVTSTTERASDVSETFTSTSMISSWPTIPSRAVDQNGIAVSTSHDAFGRKVLAWVDTGTRKSILSRVIYGDEPSGRRVTVETFPGDVNPGEEETTADKQSSTAEIDALGRVRFTVHELGADYDHARIIADLTDYDLLGRATFVAAPFETGDNPFFPDPLAEPFGTSVVYDRRGRVVREITAHGRRPDATETSVNENVFVRSLGYHYENGQRITTGLGADESDPTSSNSFALDVAYMTALGREVRRARHAPGGERIDLVEQDWDRLGRVHRLRRYLEPGFPTAAIVWASEFDSLGRRLTSSEPGTSTHYSSYDEDGNEIMSWWQDGARRRVSTATYDGFGRVTGRTLSSVDGSGVETVESSDTFYYDHHSGRSEQPDGDYRGRLSWAETAGVGAVFYGYDTVGRSSSISYLYQDHNQLVREATSRALGGRLQSLELTTPYGTDVIDYEYDSAERLRRVLRGGKALVDARDVDAKGRYRRIAYLNGVEEGFDYAQFGTEDLLSWSAAGHLYEYLERDGAGRLRFERETTPSDTTWFTYQHDALGRLSAMSKGTGGIPGVEAYTHDPLGNLLTRTATTGVSDLVYQPDVADPDRMCRIDASGNSGPCQFKYDGAGNVLLDLTGPAERAFTYDAGQRITQINRGDNAVGLMHGPVGRARTRVMTPDGGREIWHFGLIEERRLANGVTHVERRIPGPMGANVSLRTEIDGGASTSTVIYAHGDGRGNRIFTDEYGAIVQTASYGTYGQTTTTANGGALTQTDDLWNGGDNLPEVGVVLLGPRAYDPEVGRFLQRDPIRVALRASNANPYSFAFSDPVNFSDPTGLSPLMTITKHITIGGSGSGGGGGGAGAIAFGVAAVGLLAEHISLSPQYALNAVGADGFIGGSIMKQMVLQNGVCTGWCEFRRDVSSTVGTAASQYGDYMLGQADALLETAVAVGNEGLDVAQCYGNLAYCTYNKLRAAPAKAQQAYDAVRSIPAVAEAAWDDPIGFMCGANGCSARDIGRIKKRAEIAIAGTIEGGQGLARMLSRLRRMCRGGVCPCFVAGTAVAVAEGSRAIEDVRVGDRVWPSSESCEATEIDDGFALTLLMAGPDGDVVEIELLRPREWLEHNRIRVRGDIYLTLDDLNVTGWATVLGVESVPAIPADVGCIVTGTIRHLSEDVITVVLERGDPLEVTRHHRLFSATRGAWVAAGDLMPTEELETRDGHRVVVREIVRDSRPAEVVYNLEVADGHEYFVGTEEVLAHNTYGAGGIFNRAGQAYPEVRNPGTGELIPHPGNGLQRVPVAERVPWGAQERGAFIKEWYDRGLPTPEGGWARYDIHHIRPREYGGTNAFENLVPVERNVHQTAFNTWWRDY